MGAKRRVLGTKRRVCEEGTQVVWARGASEVRRTRAPGGKRVRKDVWARGAERYAGRVGTRGGRAGAQGRRVRSPGVAAG